MNKKRKIAPSILAADFARLAEQVELVEKAGADLIHVDVMDGHFVPNISIGVPVVASLRRVTELPLDVHLMIENPADYIEAFANAGADFLTIHLEACPNLSDIIRTIKSKNVKAGIAINPATPVDSLDYNFLEDVDLVLIMAVNPGFGGQKFIPETLTRLKQIQAILLRRNIHHVEVETDGGITLDNVKEVANAGADILVSGSGIYNTSDPAETISKMEREINV